jgi:hypothetical protein
LVGTWKGALAAGGWFNKDGIGDLSAQANFGAAHLTQHGAAVIQDFDFGQFAKTHFPQTVANRFLTFEFLHADFLPSPNFGQR